MPLRGPFMAFFPIFKLLGQLIGALVSFSVIDSESRSAYRLCFATQWPFSGLLSLLSLLLPESPVWLLRKERETAASKSLLRLRGGRNGRSGVSLESPYALIKRCSTDASYPASPSRLRSSPRRHRIGKAGVAHCPGDLHRLLQTTAASSHAPRVLRRDLALIVRPSAVGQRQLLPAADRHGCIY